MPIRPATPHDLPAVMRIVAETVAEMKTLGNDQWDESYPLLDRFQTDLDNNALHVAEQNNEVIGFIVLDQDQPPEYAPLNWRGKKPFVVHRLAISATCRSKGTATSLIDHASALARSLHKKSLRVDTHSTNLPMQKFLSNRGFTKIGEMDYHGKSRPYFCYEKVLLDK